MGGGTSSVVAYLRESLVVLALGGAQELEFLQLTNVALVELTLLVNECAQRHHLLDLQHLLVHCCHLSQ